MKQYSAFSKNEDGTVTLHDVLEDGNVSTLGATFGGLIVLGSTDGDAIGPIHILNNGGTVGTALSIDSRPVGGQSWSFLATGTGAGAPAGSFAFYQAGGGYRMTLAQNGNVGIGFESPAERLQVNGRISCVNVITTLTTYANDAAADADTNLPSGAFYKLTGSRTVFQKP